MLFITIIYIISSHKTGMNITAYSEMFYKSECQKRKHYTSNFVIVLQSYAKKASQYMSIFQLRIKL